VVGESRYAGPARPTVRTALEVATGKVTDACYPQHRNEEFPNCAKQVVKA
jgi:hypothetical protein